MGITFAKAYRNLYETSIGIQYAVGALKCAQPPAPINHNTIILFRLLIDIYRSIHTGIEKQLWL